MLTLLTLTCGEQTYFNLLIPRLARPASIGLILFLVGVLPANISAAFNYVAFGAHELGPIYLLARIPFQVFLMGWAYFFGIRTLPRATSVVPRGRWLRSNIERIIDA